MDGQALTALTRQKNILYYIEFSPICKAFSRELASQKKDASSGPGYKTQV
jgi:hypothetical protein